MKRDTYTTQAQPRERPILFNSDMVRALLAGTKTQTRRVCKAKRDLGSGCALAPHELAGEVNQLGEYSNSPYGKPGDRLWVRETFYAFGRWETRYSAKKKRDEWHFVDMTLESDKAYQYAADGADVVPMKQTRYGGVFPRWWKRPAIFMPRAASRITLEVTGVHVERLRAITEADALAEGIVPHVRGGWHWHPHNPSDLDDWHQFGFKTAALAYESLWEQINGSGSWDANPWVWCVLFRVVKT